MGYRGIGVANVWHNDPLIFYSNPALSALHEGLSYGYRHENWLKGSGYEDFYYDVGLLNLCYKGVAITLPAPNDTDRFGVNFDYGKVSYTTEDIFGPVLYYNPQESAQVYGLSVNTLDTILNRQDYPDFLQNIDICVGVNLLQIRSDIVPAGLVQEQNLVRHPFANSINAGGIIRYEYWLNRFVKLEGVYGHALFNVNKDKIKYRNDYPADTIYRHSNQGVAGAFTLVSQKPIFAWQGDSQDVLSCRVLASVIDNYNSNKDITAKGFEIGLMDVFYIRQGYYDYSSGHITGNTYGYGVNLNYKKLVSYSYNYSSIPGGDLVNRIKSSDHSVTVNFMELFAPNTQTKQ
jgi:hypothetical protein